MTQKQMLIDELAAHARASDPASSHIAADRHKKSGRMQSNKDRILAFIRKNGGMTSKEIATRIEIDRVECARRTSDLQNAGLIVGTSYAGNEKRWWITKPMTKGYGE